MLPQTWKKCLLLFVCATKLEEIERGAIWKKLALTLTSRVKHTCKSRAPNDGFQDFERPQTENQIGEGERRWGIAAWGMALHTAHRNMLQNAAQLCVVALKLVQHIGLLRRLWKNPSPRPPNLPPFLKPGKAPN